MSHVPYVALGAVSLLLQITVLRELLTVFSGNELDIGITLSLWLVSVGAGSFMGSRVRAGNAFGYSFVLVSFLAVPTLSGIHSIRAVLSLEAGEAASLGATFLSTAVVLLPLCFSLGLQFPLAVSARWRTSSVRDAPIRSGPRPGAAPAAEVYALEAAGAFLGGLCFTFVLAGRVGPEALTLSLASLNILLAALVLGQRAAAMLLAVPVLLYLGGGALGDYLSGLEPAPTVLRAQSRYGEIRVTRLKGQFNLYQAGHLLFSHPDPQTLELKAHLPMSVYQGTGPRRVLAVGGSAGIIGEFLKYPIERIDYVEMDPVLVETAMGFLVEEERRWLKDKRVRIVTEDGRRFIKSLKGTASYDMIVINLPAPSTANMNRFYTVEFFLEAREVMARGAVLTLTLPPSSGYVGRRTQLANGSVLNSLGAVFGHVKASTEEYGLLIASDRTVDLALDELSERYKERAIRTRHFRPYIIDDAFSPIRRGLFMERLGAVEAVNTDLRPAAYLYNLMLWAEMHRAWLLDAVLRLRGYSAVLFLTLFPLAAVLVFGRRRRTLYYSMLGTGYAGMAYLVAILLSYQASFGYVYEMFGLLSAVFMAGMAGGAYLLRRIRMKGLRALFMLELGAAALALSCALFFRAEGLFYVFSLLAGMVTGGGFALVNGCMGGGEEPGDTGGRLYAVDLLGSFAGASLSALIFVPVLGIRESLYMVAAIKLLSAAMVRSIK
jgi:spermidine synthase